MEPREEQAVWRFREFELDERLCELRRAGRRVPLQRKPYQLLVYLVANRHRVVSRADLLRVVWQGVAVSDAAFASALRDLRRALGDSGRASWAIVTIPGFGYRFIARVDAQVVAGETARAVAGRGDEGWRWALAQKLVELLENEVLAGLLADRPTTARPPGERIAGGARLLA